MRPLLVFLTSFTAVWTFPGWATARSSPIDIEILRSGVFKIRVSSAPIDYRVPWKLKPQRHSSGSGFFIGSGRIMTNAHVVANAHYITVQKDNDSNLVEAEVEFIAHDCDLAILKPKDKGILKGLGAPIWGKVPKLRSPVSTVGFPTGGQQISVTKGVVSRVDYRRYVHPYDAHHLLVQVDSAINPGNSGGPVFQGKKLAGVAFQSNRRAESTGYIIPTPVVKRFLDDIKDGVYDGHPEDGITFSAWSLANKATQKFHRLKKGQEGVKIDGVKQFSSFWGVLQPNDVLLKVNGHPIGFDGKVDFEGERVEFKVIYDLMQAGQFVDFELIRGQFPLKTKVVLQKNKHRQFTGLWHIKRPQYFMTAGLMFTSLSRNYLKSFGHHWYSKVPSHLKYLYYHGAFDPYWQSRHDSIVLIKKFPHKVNHSLQSYEHLVVNTVNGRAPHSFDRFVDLMQDRSRSFLRLSFRGHRQDFILKTEKLDEINASILRTYKINPPLNIKRQEGVKVLFGKK